MYVSHEARWRNQEAACTVPFQNAAKWEATDEKETVDDADNKKRGKVLETDSLDDGLIKLVCRIPQVEILEFAIDLRSITQGQGLYDYHFDGYEIVNDDLVERLLKK